MEAQFNFQIKQKKDERGWEDIEIYYVTNCDRITATRYARKISKIFKSEIRLTQGSEPLKVSGTYIYETN